jgi:hypothetical protein
MTTFEKMRLCAQSMDLGKVEMLLGPTISLYITSSLAEMTISQKCFFTGKLRKFCPEHKFFDFSISKEN